MDQTLEPRCERVQRNCTESVNGYACPTSPEVFIQVDSETTLSMPLKAVNTMGAGYIRQFTNYKGKNEEQLAKSFAKLVLEGKINAAMKLLDPSDGSGVLPLSQSTINELKRKYPVASEADPSLLMDGEPQFVDPVLFQNIIESTIANAALQTMGF